MLPALQGLNTVETEVEDYLQGLVKQGFLGDVSTDYASRLTCSTDNSIYQVIPQAILFPKQTRDVSLALKLASTKAFSALKFYPRGGGTGTNGQSLGPGIVIDLSRYMTEIVEIDPSQRRAKVQAGLIKDALNKDLKPFGLFFSPDLSTSNRATIGGMINTDAAGQGSLVYGKTSNHVQGLTLVLANGQVVHLSDTSADVSDLEAPCREVLLEYAGQIKKNWPKLPRFATGYDLYHALDEAKQQVDLIRLICGSEGTLGVITEAVLDLDPLPNKRILVNVCYQCFDAALRHAPEILKAKAISIETQDEQVLALARTDTLWPTVAPWLGIEATHALAGLNIIEFAGTDAFHVEMQVNAFVQTLKKNRAVHQHGIIGFDVCWQEEVIEQVYALRKKAVGLLGRLQGVAKPVAFVEDTAVPPARLADYIREFRALLDNHGLQYGMFGHIDAGVLHVRPALDLMDVTDREKLKQIADAVFALTQKYQGVLWGEHGRGQRSEYGPEFFGELWPVMCAIKTIFDPLSRLNPGKIAISTRAPVALSRVNTDLRADFDQRIPVQVRHSFAQTLACNGNGLCFDFEPTHTMCPSMRVTQDRRHSPKGRAHLMREWLRLVSEKDFDCRQAMVSTQRRPVFGRQPPAPDDFSQQVYDTMAGCLGCKACATQCPVHVDIPQQKALFLHIYHQFYPRKIRDYILAYTESLLPWLAKGRWLWNRVFRSVHLLTHQVGLVDLPAFSRTQVAHWARQNYVQPATPSVISALSQKQRQRCVVVVQDGFTRFMDADLVCAWLAVIQKLGYQPYLLPYQPVGKSYYVQGFLPQFRKCAQALAKKLSELAVYGLPLVGIDPAMTLSFRDEYPKMLGREACRFRVLLPQEWLVNRPHHQPLTEDSPRYYLLSHCTEKAFVPSTAVLWQRVFAQYGLTLEIVKTGCCGMAGTFGHEQEHVQQSKDLFALSWQEMMADKNIQHVLATGYSCRSQAMRIYQHKIQHPIEILNKYLG